MGVWAVVYATVAGASPAVSGAADTHDRLVADTLAGQVREMDGTPVDGANVFVLGTLDGAVSDSLGRFSFVAANGGILVVRHPAFLEARLPFDVPFGFLDVVLQRAAMELQPIVVEAGSYSGGEEGDVTLTSLDVVTTPGAAADVFRAMQTFAGVQTAGDGGGLVVRGGDIAETKVLLDGAVVMAPYRWESPTGDAFGAFDPFLLDGIFFSSGGFGAAHGDALSGLVQLETLDRPETKSAQVSASLAALSGRVGLGLPGRSGLRVAGTRSNTGLLFRVNGTKEDFEQVPDGSELSANLALDYSSTGSMKLFWLGQADRFTVTVDEPSHTGSFDSENETDLIALSGRDLFGPVALSWSASRSGRGRAQQFGVYAVDEDDGLLQARADVTWELDHGIVGRVGGVIERRRAGLRGSIPESGHDVRPGARQTVFESTSMGTRRGAYLESDLRLIRALRVRAGLRMDVSTLARGGPTWDPRLSAAWRPAEAMTMTAAWGRYHQVPAPLFHEPTLGDPDLPSMNAEHAVIGMDWGVERRRLRVEVYRKTYRDLAQLTRDYGVRGGGTGRSTGADLFLMGTGPWGIEGRLALSWIAAERTDPDTGLLARSPYDISRSLVVIAQKTWRSRWQLGVTYKTATGRPFTPVEAAEFDPVEAVWVPEYGVPFGERLPRYARLDVSASLLHSFGEDNLTVFFVSVANLANRMNFSVYRYSEDYASRSPAAIGFTRSVYFGASTSFGY